MTGAAHMLEHMLFKGTTNLGSTDWSKEEPLLAEVNRLGAKLDKARRDNESPETIEKIKSDLAKASAEQKKYVVSEIYSKIYSSAGGVGFNAGTSKDLTTYIIRMPANKLELWAWIESDRLKNAVFREFYSERDVVLEERRRSYENRATGKLYERFLASAFIAHPYGEPIIGWPADISRLPLSEVQRFWDTWYVPNNAAIAIVGDVKVEEVERVVRKYFSDIPARPLPERVVTTEPVQGGRREIEISFDASPTFFIGFHKPAWDDPDDDVMTVIDGLLSTGRTSRLNVNIVRKKKIALSAGTFTAPGSRYPNEFMISGEPLPPNTVKDLEKAVWEELEKLKNEPVGDEELEKVKTNLQADFIRGLVSHYGMARLLAYYQQITGDWRNVVRETERIEAVTAEDIERVAKKIFTQENATVANIVSKDKSK